MFKAIPLFSGSSGNCAYINCDGFEVLIDAGVSYKKICTALCSIGTDIKNIKAVLVTHEHTDHIKALDVLASHNDCKIYINEQSAEYFGVPCDELFCGKAIIKNPDENILFDKFEVDIFKTPHDSLGSVGYHFNLPDGERFAYATDMGVVTDKAKSFLCGCKSVIIESNHDLKMLKCGPYPFHLKKRILSDKGHLSNEACAEILPFLVENGTSKIVLAHLSRENNTPLLAYKTAAEALAEAGFTPNDVKLTVAPESII